MTDRERLRGEVVEALDSLEDWQLRLVARAARQLDARGYGNAPFILGFPRLEYADGRVTGEMEITQAHLNPLGVAHGMVAFGLLDNSMGQAISTSTGRPCIQVDMKIQFVRPLTPPKASVETEVVRTGGKIATAMGRAYDASGELAVLAIGTYYFVRT